MMKTILIVDDEQDILDLLQFNLEAEGYQIMTAMNGEKALELAESFQPDLIILDVMLPGKDGWEVIRELSNNAETQHLPVIFLTAKDSEIDEVVGLELGADDYILSFRPKGEIFRGTIMPASNVWRTPDFSFALRRTRNDTMPVV